MNETIETRVAVHESVLENHERLFSRIDTSIEKLGDISSSLKEMVVAHENKIVNQGKSQDELYALVETHRKESERRSEMLSHDLSNTTVLVEEKIAGLQKSVTAEFTAVKRDFGEKITEVLAENNKKILSFEKIKWLIIGGVAVLLIFLDKTNILSTLMSTLGSIF